jgi:hypothetical protein
MIVIKFKSACSRTSTFIYAWSPAHSTNARPDSRSIQPESVSTTMRSSSKSPGPTGRGTCKGPICSASGGWRQTVFYDASFRIARAESSSAPAQSSAAQVSLVSTATSASSSTAETPQRTVSSPAPTQSSPAPMNPIYASSSSQIWPPPAMYYSAFALILYKAILANMLAFRKMAAAKRASDLNGSQSELEKPRLPPLAQEVLMSVLSQTMQAFRTRKSLSQEQVQALLQHMSPSARKTICHVAQGR